MAVRRSLLMLALAVGLAAPSDGAGAESKDHQWPFGTKVRVINLDNDRTVQVRIVDRLAKRSTAIIDLSHKAARELRPDSDWNQ